MDNVEKLKALGNEAANKSDWNEARCIYSKGIEICRDMDSHICAVLLSNRSFVLAQLGLYDEALSDAKEAILFDSNYDKGYIRIFSAYDGLFSCTQDHSYKISAYLFLLQGYQKIPESKLLKDTLQAMSTDRIKSLTQKKVSGSVFKIWKQFCSDIIIRGAVGPNKARINGVYMPMDDIGGGWPLYRKKEREMCDSVIIEYNCSLEEWMIKHKSWIGTNHCFARSKVPSFLPLHDCQSAWNYVEDKKINSLDRLNVMKFDLFLQDECRRFSVNKMNFKIFEIRGAKCNLSSYINGVYAASDICRGGWPLVLKVAGCVKDFDVLNCVSIADACKEILKRILNKILPDDNNLDSSAFTDKSIDVNRDFIVIEFDAVSSTWQIKQFRKLGSQECFAQCHSSTIDGCFPYSDIDSGIYPIWEIWEDDNFTVSGEIYSMTIEGWKIEDERMGSLWRSPSPLFISPSNVCCKGNIQGIYSPNCDVLGEYIKDNDSNYVLQYNRRKGCWQFSGYGVAYAFSMSHDKSFQLPYTAGLWKVMTFDCKWECDVDIKIIDVDEYFKQCRIDFGLKLDSAVAIDVRGATGMNAFKVNGIYEPTKEICSDWPVYRRVGSNEYWLEYHGVRKNWQIKNAANRCVDSAFAYIDATEPNRPELCPGVWWVYVGMKCHDSDRRNSSKCSNGTYRNGWEMQPQISIMSVEEREKEDMKQYLIRRDHCFPIDIRGASGPRGVGLNGIFEPINEMKGGWPVYRKRSDPDWWLEYDAYPQKWMVRPTSCRGSSRGRAYIICSPELRPEQAVGLWRISDGKGGWSIEFSVTVRLESEARASDLTMYHARFGSAVAVDIRGFYRPMSYLNGVYEPQKEFICGWPIYRQKGNENHVLEYCEISREWQLKPSCCQGTTKNWAHISSHPTHPELVTGSHWSAFIDGHATKMDSVTLCSVEQRQEEDKMSYCQRKCQCCSVIVENATGPWSDKMNGIYDPSCFHSSSGWPSYSKRDNSSSWLEYNAYALSWTIWCQNDRSLEENQVVVSKHQNISAVDINLPKESESNEECDQDSYVECDPTEGSLVESLPAKVEIIDCPISKNLSNISQTSMLLSYLEVSERVQRPERCCGSSWKVLTEKGSFEVCKSMIVKELVEKSTRCTAKKRNTPLVVAACTTMNTETIASVDLSVNSENQSIITSSMCQKCPENEYDPSCDTTVELSENIDDCTECGGDELSSSSCYEDDWMEVKNKKGKSSNGDKVCSKIDKKVSTKRKGMNERTDTCSIKDCSSQSKPISLPTSSNHDCVKEDEALEECPFPSCMSNLLQEKFEVINDNILSPTLLKTEEESFFGSWVKESIEKENNSFSELRKHIEFSPRSNIIGFFDHDEYRHFHWSDCDLELSKDELMMIVNCQDFATDFGCCDDKDSLILPSRILSDDDDRLLFDEPPAESVCAIINSCDSSCDDVDVIRPYLSSHIIEDISGDSCFDGSCSLTITKTVLKDQRKICLDKMTMYPMAKICCSKAMLESLKYHELGVVKRLAGSPNWNILMFPWYFDMKRHDLLTFHCSKFEIDEWISLTSWIESFHHKLSVTFCENERKSLVHSAAMILFKLGRWLDFLHSSCRENDQLHKGCIILRNLQPSNLLINTRTLDVIVTNYSLSAILEDRGNDEPFLKGSIDSCDILFALRTVYQEYSSMNFIGHLQRLWGIDTSFFDPQIWITGDINVEADYYSMARILQLIMHKSDLSQPLPDSLKDYIPIMMSACREAKPCQIQEYLCDNMID